MNRDRERWQRERAALRQGLEERVPLADDFAQQDTSDLDLPAGPPLHKVSPRDPKKNPYRDIVEQCHDASNGPVINGRFLMGSRVQLSAIFEQCDDASNGPLTPGAIGTVTRDDRSSKPYLVEAPDGSTWWYERKALVAPKVLTAELAAPGVRVVPGQDWKWGGHNGGVGTLLRMDRAGWWSVAWDSGEKNSYRVGHDGCYDLYMYVLQPTSDDEQDDDVEEQDAPELVTELLEHQQQLQQQLQQERHDKQQAQAQLEQLQRALSQEREQGRRAQAQLEQAQELRQQAEQALAQEREQRQQAERRASTMQDVVTRTELERQQAHHRAEQAEQQLQRTTQSGSVHLQPLPNLNEFRLQHFQIIRRLGGGANGMVFEVEWRASPTSATKRYALKMCYNLGITGITQVQDHFRNEYAELARLPPHPNVNQYCCAFVDSVADVVMVYLREHAPAVADLAVTRNRHTGQEQRRECQYFVVELQDTTLATYLRDWPEGQATTPFAISVVYDVGQALLHCALHGVLHLDIKADNVLLEPDLACATGTRALLCDFGCARRFDPPTRLVQLATSTDWYSQLWGNPSHVCPELHNAHNARTDLDFSGQPVFELGVLGLEIVLDEHPLGQYPLGHGTSGHLLYDVDRTVRHRVQGVVEAGEVAQGLFELLLRMIAFNPAERPSLEEALEELRRLMAVQLQQHEEQRRQEQGPL